MTYSRPGTSTVNALQLPQPYQPLGAPDEQRVRVTSNGPLLNYINPAQAGQNAGKDAAAIGSFLESTLKIGGPILAKSFEDRAQTQAAEFLSKNTDVAALYNSANAQGRALIRSLNGRTQDIVGNATAQAAANEYLQIYRANRADDRTFITPGVPAEQLAAAETRAKGNALRISGLENIPSRYLSPYVAGLLEGEGRIRAETYDLALREGNKLNESRFSDAYGKQIEGAIQQRAAGMAGFAANTPPDQAIIDQPGAKDFAVSWIKQQRDFYAGEIKRVLASGDYTPSEFAAVVFNGWKSAILRQRTVADENGDYDVSFVMTMLERMQAITNSGASVDGEINLWDVALPEGGTIRDRLKQMAADLQPEYEKWQQKQALLPFMPNLIGVAQGQLGAREAAINALPSLAGNPEAFQNALSLLSQSQSTADTPSAEKNRNFANLQMQLNNPNRDRRAFNQAILQSNLTWQQKAELARANQENPDPSAAQAFSGIARNEAEIKDAARLIFSSGVQSGKFQGLDANGARAKIEEIETGLRASVQRQTTERIKALRASGKDVSDTQAYEFSREFVDRYRESEIKKLGGSGDQQQTRTPAQRALETAQTVQANLNRTGGVGTIAVFPPDVINAARQAGVPIDYRNVQKFYLRQLAGFKDANGKPLFPDPQKAYQEMVKRAQEEARRRGGTRPGGPQSAAPPQQFNPGSIPVVGFLQGLAQSVGLSPAPATSARPAGGGSSRSGQPRPGAGQQRPQQTAQANPAERLLSGALGAVVGIFDQPASAAERPAGQGGGGQSRPAGAGARNMTTEGMSAMAALWSGSQPMTPIVPPLPQVDGAAMAQPIPMAISNPNHPFFVAIGIAEGTRTPNGGYTRAYYGHRDPGSGAANVGTVSGQNGGNPQAVDRRWMGILTQKQLQMAPVLQQLGLRPGSVAFNRVMFNVLDLSVQSPLAATDFIRRLPSVIAQGATIEVIAKARADSYINPATGRLEASGFKNNYSRLFADQRSRAGAFDYKRRF